MSEIVIDIILNGHFEENTIFVHRDGCLDGVLVDPGIGKKRIMTYLEENKYNVKYILITHSHIDHIYSCNDIRDKYGCDIYVSKYDLEAMNDIEKNESDFFHLPVKVDNCKTFDDGDILHFLDIDFKCIITPGHTKGSTCFYIEEEKILLAGDTLFAGGYGRTDYYGGSATAMRDSLINKIFVLPKDTKVFPGHGSDTTIGNELETNMIFY